MEIDDFRDHIASAFSSGLSDESEMVTRWVALIEVMDSDGQRACYVMAPEGAKPWDTLGLLTFAVQVEQAAALSDD